MNTWAELDRISIEQCVNQEGQPDFDVDECVHEAGADQTMFQHERTTPGRYWSEALGLSFVADLILTAIAISLFLVTRWVIRGFKAEPK